MCSDKECKAIRSGFKFLVNLIDLDEQLEKCQKCVYKKQKNHIKDKTYKEIRIIYAQRYNTCSTNEKSIFSEKIWRDIENGKSFIRSKN